MIKPWCMLKWNTSLLVRWFALCTPPEIKAFPNFCCYLSWESSFSLLVSFHNLGVANVRSESYSYITREHSLLFHELWWMEIRLGIHNQDMPDTHNPDSCSNLDKLLKALTCMFMFPFPPQGRTFLCFKCPVLCLPLSCYSTSGIICAHIPNTWGPTWASVRSNNVDEALWRSQKSVGIMIIQVQPVLWTPAVCTSMGR